jgi:ribose transport system substrate-binding protein
MNMNKKTIRAIALGLMLLLLAAACSTATPESEGQSEAAGGESEAAQSEAASEAASEGGEESAGRTSEWYDEEQFTTQLAQRDIEPEGPADAPWEQAIEPEMGSTEEFATQGGGTVCFSNAGVNNPWRVVGYTTMQEEVKLHDNITDFVHVDAEGNDEKQISDIQELIDGGECAVLIVSPNTTAALTPAVEAACEELPVIVFDRGVNTDCPVTFIHPIGGYAFGADAAEFLAENVEPGGNILALRILPGVDVLETRYVAAQIILEEAGLNIVGAEFTEGDAAKTKNIVSDYLQRGNIDGVFMDAGATAVAAVEAFEDNGVEVPPITGEDQLDFLRKWQQDGLTAVAPTYSNFQWRTAIIAASRVMAGEEIPLGEWVLPQPLITQENLGDYDLGDELPPLHYALCGCEDMPGYPGPWQ